MLSEAKEIRKYEKEKSIKTDEISLSPFIKDEIDRTSINGKAAEIFLNRLTTSEIANSLFVIDKSLFQKVVPWQCLGSVWSRRGHGSEISTVKVKKFWRKIFIYNPDFFQKKFNSGF